MKINEHLTVSRASRRADLDPRLLRAAIQEGEIPAIQPGKRALYVAWADVERWLNSARFRPGGGRGGD